MERLNIETLLNEIAKDIKAIGEVNSASELNDKYICIAMMANDIATSSCDDTDAMEIHQYVMEKLDHICNYNLVRIAHHIYTTAEDSYEAEFQLSMCKLSLKGEEEQYTEELDLLDGLINTIREHGTKRNTINRN